MLLAEVVCDGHFQMLWSNEHQVAVDMNGNIQATRSKRVLDAGLQQSALCRHLVADRFIVVGLAVRV